MTPRSLQHQTEWSRLSNLIKSENLSLAAHKSSLSTTGQLYPQPKFAKVDVDEQPEIAKEAGVKIMPTFIAYKDGKAIGTALGADRQKLEDFLTKVSASS
ncbi:hypothetical protein L204_102972 [Cryptococcus depauperatus]